LDTGREKWRMQAFILSLIAYKRSTLTNPQKRLIFFMECQSKLHYIKWRLQVPGKEETTKLACCSHGRTNDPSDEGVVQLEGRLVEMERPGMLAVADATFAFFAIEPIEQMTS